MNIKFKKHCFYCYTNLFPNEKNVKNYKTKEKTVSDYILEHFPIEKYDWKLDKII